MPTRDSCTAATSDYGLPNCIAAMGRWSVPVGMMHVRDVRVRVALPLMAMPMRVRLPGGVICGTGMLMVFVMHVRMGMLQRLMFVLVTVMLGEVQPDTHTHK